MIPNDRDVTAAVVAARQAQQAYLGRALARAPGAVARLLGRAVAGWRRALARDAARRRLEALDDRLLGDMGLLRGTLDRQLRAAERTDRAVAGATVGVGPTGPARPANQDSPAGAEATRAA